MGLMSVITNIWGAAVSLTTVKTDLSERLKNETWDIHTRVEQHKFVKELLNDTLAKADYYQHLTDLALVYKTLEEGFERNIGKYPSLSTVYFKEIERFPAIKKDLDSLDFNKNRSEVSEAAVEYAVHLSYLADYKPLLLIAHAYVRYLGDLSGGVFLKNHINKKWPDAVNLYDFSALLQETGLTPFKFKNFYKNQLDLIPFNEKDIQDLIKEAQFAFEQAENLFDAITFE